jgi:hypothetical protein
MRIPVRRFIGVALISLASASWVPSAKAQGQVGTGAGFVPQPYGPGMISGLPGVAAVPMYPIAGGQRGVGLGTASAAMTDPLGLGYVYGPAIPMTPAQTGLFMLSAQQRMFGLGNGQISGVRPGADADARSALSGRTPSNSPGSRRTAAHTRNSNVPGGQAARFFNRGATASPESRTYYKRQMRYFPQTTQ